MFGKQLFCRFVAFLQISLLTLTFLPESSAQKKIPETVYSNTAPITINTSSGLTAPTVATFYPSIINISGLMGTITNVEVTLKGVTHNTLNQLDFLLVSPTGVKFIFLADGGGFNQVEDHVYTFSDAASTTLPAFQPITSGTYRPTSGDAGADTFPSPAPPAPYGIPPGANLSIFNGTNPNGTWLLYAVDDTLGINSSSAGAIYSGWELRIKTDAGPQTFINSNTNYIGLHDVLATATPYGSTINVSGASGVISNLKVTLTGLTHPNSTQVDILLVSPNGKGLILMSDVGSAAGVSNANLTFDDAAADSLGSVIVSGTYKPTDIIVETDTFPPPAPQRPYISGGFNQLSNFNGANPNGDWQLFVVDDTPNSAGTISGGWTLDITTVPTPPPTPVGCAAPFFSPANYATGVNPTNLAVADFNNDTKPDLAVTNQISNDVSILLGNGDGTFMTQTLITAGSSPYAVVAGKFNADNNFDLAVANSGSNTVSILLGNGNGTFSAPTNFFVGSSPISIAMGDFNNDAKQDLAVANFGGFFFGSVSILLGNGSGGFTAGNNVRTRTQPAFVTEGNLNGDANQDLIVANFGADSVSTFFGNGNGTFTLSQNLPTGAGPVAIEIIDYTNDGFPDLFIANYNADTLTGCTGSSNGTFSNCGVPGAAIGANPISLASADFLGNGTQVLATALSGTNRVNLLSNNINVGQNPNVVETADFNSDGKPDLVTANSGSNDVSVLINSCLIAKGNLFDFNGDRKTDYSVFRPSSATWWVNSLNPTGVTKLFARPTDTVVPADYNGDRLTDFAFYRPESGLWHVIDRNSLPISYLQFGMPGDIAAPADFDGDNLADIAVWRPLTGEWFIRRSTDNSVQTVAFGMNGDKPVPADFDGDGKADVAVYRPSTGFWFILRSSDSQTSSAPFGISEDKTVPADYDGDGKADLAVFRPSTGVWYIYRSSDGGYTIQPWGDSTDVPVPGEYDGDGKFDIAIYRPVGGVWIILRSSDLGVTGFQWGVPTDIPLPSAFVR